VVIWKNINIGPMKKAEERTQGGDILWPDATPMVDISEELVEADPDKIPSAALMVLPVAAISELENLKRRRFTLATEIQGTPQEREQSLLDVRIPASLALWISRDLRNEGRSPEGRDYVRRMRVDLESAGISRWWYYLGLERLAQIEMAIGSSWTDEDEPTRAEEELKKAVERLEGIEQRMVEVGASERQMAPVRAIRCTALVSLAVNANVKQHDPDKALAYYERAYELRQDDFMRILLACYRARSGRAEEARALLREVRPYGQVYYNIACTHALLGEKEQALEMLERELNENYASAASRERQKEWAREDPDLASLRGDPRFEQLVGAN